MIRVKGRASGTTRTIEVPESDLDELLLFWLRKNGVTIASSCDGEGVCKRCEIQNGWLTCQMTVGLLLRRSPAGEVEVSYL